MAIATGVVYGIPGEIRQRMEHWRGLELGADNNLQDLQREMPVWGI